MGKKKSAFLATVIRKVTDGNGFVELDENGNDKTEQIRLTIVAVDMDSAKNEAEAKFMEVLAIEAK